MLGGDADKYGTLNWTHFITSEQAQEWEDSIKFNMMPVTYSLVPITTLISVSAFGRHRDSHCASTGSP